MRSLLTTASLVLGDAALQQPWLLMEDGIVSALGARSAVDLPEHDILYDFPEAMLTPALIDIHIHGAAGHDVMEATPCGTQRHWPLSSTPWHRDLFGHHRYGTRG